VKWTFTNAGSKHNHKGIARIQSQSCPNPETGKGTKMMASQISKKSYAQLPDTELIILCQRHDEPALNELLKRHKSYIVNRLYKLAPDLSDQSDLIQEVYIRVWRFIGQLKKPSSFRAWLSQLVTNVFYDELRKRPRNNQVISLDEPITNDSSEESTRDIKDCSQQPDDLLLAKELSQVLKEAMQDIPIQFRTAEILRDVEGLSYEEICRVTHAELGTVKSRIARARMKIQEKLQSYLQQCA
jgi:RNA polymerase sigma-70 factor (ECF subfamily)